jgi:RNA polymerase sigma factor (sigma-70 family)
VRREAVASRPAASSGRRPAARPGALHGDEAELFRLHHRALLRHVRRAALGAPEALIEDACLFAWLQLLRHQPERDHVRGWLCTVARREAWRLAREAKALTSLDAGKASGEPRSQEPLVETIPGRDSVDAAHAAREALRTLASLPDKQRRYLALKVAGYSYREICALTGASYTNVNKHLTRARACVAHARAA